MLSSEMSHGMSQIGVPHFTHAMRNAVCDEVDAQKLTKFLIVVICMVVAAKEQHIMPKTGGITLKMRHCFFFFFFFFFFHYYYSMGNSETLNVAWQQ